MYQYTVFLIVIIGAFGQISCADFLRCHDSGTAPGFQAWTPHPPCLNNDSCSTVYLEGNMTITPKDDIDQFYIIQEVVHAVASNDPCDIEGSKNACDGNYGLNCPLKAGLSQTLHIKKDVSHCNVEMPLFIMMSLSTNSEPRFNEIQYCSVRHMRKFRG